MEPKTCWECFSKGICKNRLTMDEAISLFVNKPEHQPDLRNDLYIVLAKHCKDYCEKKEDPHEGKIEEIIKS